MAALAGSSDGAVAETRARPPVRGGDSRVKRRLRTGGAATTHAHDRPAIGAYFHADARHRVSIRAPNPLHPARRRAEPGDDHTHRARPGGSTHRGCNLDSTTATSAAGDRLRHDHVARRVRANQTSFERASSRRSGRSHHQRRVGSGGDPAGNQHLGPGAGPALRGCPRRQCSRAQSDSDGDERATNADAPTAHGGEFSSGDAGPRVGLSRALVAAGQHAGSEFLLPWPGAVRRALVFGLALLAVVLSGCGPVVDQRNLQERADTPAGVLGGPRTVAQTFVAGCDRLSEIDLQLAVYPNVPDQAGQTVVDVAAADQPRHLLAEARYDDASVVPNSWVAVAFAPVARSRGQTFQVTAWSTSPGRSAVVPWATDHWSDPAGERLQNGQAVSGELVYRAWCDPTPLRVARDTLSSVERTGLLWPVALLLVLLPGVGVSTFLDTGEPDFAAILGGAVGWSVLLAPLTLAAFTPLRGARAAGLVLPLLGVIALIWMGSRALRRRPQRKITASDDHDTAPIVLGLVATAAALVIRAITAMDLVVPAWGDSPQHTYVVQQILRSGGVPADYGPLVPSQVFDYHFGFQSLAAYAALLTGASAPDAVLAMGQVLNALICLAVYRFARDLTSSRWAGATAATLVALVTIQPTYYVSWGRYTELAGLVALPAAFAAYRAALAKSPRRRDLAAAVIAGGAMILIHPRVAIFLAGLATAQVLVQPGPTWRPERILRSLARLAGLGVLSLIVVSPWIVRLVRAHYQQMRVVGLDQPIDFPVGLAVTGDDRWVVALGLVGLALAVVQRDRVAPLAIIWFGLLFVAANPGTFHLPVYLYLNDGALAIAVFLPASVFAGYLLARAIAFTRRFAWPPVAPWILALALFAGALSRSPNLVGIINPTCLLVRPGDIAALNWVRTNTPSDARFLVNSYLWAPNIYQGSDAGYWLPVLTGRRTTLPFLFYAVGPAAEVAAVNDFAAKSIAAARQPDQLARLAIAHGARYVFIGTRGGNLDPGVLVASGRFRVLYSAEGAWVLEVVGGVV